MSLTTNDPAPGDLLSEPVLHVACDAAGCPVSEPLPESGVVPRTWWTLRRGDDSDSPTWHFHDRVCLADFLARLEPVQPHYVAGAPLPTGPVYSSDPLPVGAVVTLDEPGAIPAPSAQELPAVESAAAEAPAAESTPAEAEEAVAEEPVEAAGEAPESAGEEAEA